MTYTIYTNVILLLLFSVAVVVTFQHIRMPPILGYLAIGIIVGPYGLTLIPDGEQTQYLAEFGIVFLMFTVGLEFSFSKLSSMKRLVFGLGGSQVVLTTVTGLFIGLWLGLSFSTALIIGCIVAMSSTAIVSKQLSDQFELNTVHGKYAIAILLFQDLAAIPFFILIGSLGATTSDINVELLLVIVKTVVTFMLIFAAGRWILRPLFREIALTHSLELFTLSALLVTLSASWLTQRLGLSLSLGAFLAGTMLGETEYRHQIEATIRPFRDILLGLFFITIGMMFNIRTTGEIWLWTLSLLAALIIFKTVLITLIAKIFRSDWRSAMKTGLITAQGGEFGFALLTLALHNQLISTDYGQVILGALLFSMALSPLMIRHNNTIVRFVAKIFFPKKSIKKPSRAHTTLEDDLCNHVIICGFGHVGQNISRIIESESIPYIAIDLELKRVQRATKEGGYNVIYGDATLYDILIACQIQRAAAVIISFDDANKASRILQQIRSHHNEIPIFVRAVDDSNLEKLQNLGATEVIPASLEASLMLASHLMLFLGIPISRIVNQIDHIRRTRYQLFHEVISTKEGIEEFPIGCVIKITSNMHASGKSIEELNLHQYKIYITKIERRVQNRYHTLKPEPHLTLQLDDRITFYGPPNCVEQALNNLF